MRFHEVFTFDVVHESLPWPWISFAADRGCLAYASSATTVVAMSSDGDKAVNRATFELPADLAISSSANEGLRAFSVAKGGTLLAAIGNAGAGDVVTVVHASGEQKRVAVSTLTGEGHTACAVAFDRSGGRLWVALESATETVIALLEATSLEKVDLLRSAAVPRPALYEFHVHPQDDAVLLLAVCGESGTYARVAGFAGDSASLIPTDIDDGGIASGFVGFSWDGARVHLAEADELQTRSWPALHELSTVPLADDFVSSFSGAVVGTHILVDGEDVESDEDAVMLYDQTGIRGILLPGRGPVGMWAGALQSDIVITLDAKGEPSTARAWRVTPTRTELAN